MRTKRVKRHVEQMDREIEKVISHFSQHFMSNAKWVRLVDKLVENANCIKKIKFKKVQGDKIGELYLNPDTTFGFDYWQNGFEGHNSLGGWLQFKEIEYLLFPTFDDEDQRISQDIQHIEEIIRSVGEFFLEKNEDGLKLICYKV